MIAPCIGPRQLDYQNPHQQVHRVEVTFDGFCKQYFVTEVGSRTGMVVADGNRVLLVRQYRLLINDLAWEIPGGCIDTSETPAEAATREVLEETGLHCQDPEPLLFFHPGLDTFHNPTHLFLSRRHERITTFQPNPREVTECTWFPLDQCLRMIFQGEIQDSLSISGLFAFQLLADHPGLKPSP